MNENDYRDLCAIASDDFLTFCVHTDEHYFLNWHLEEIASELQEMEARIRRGEKKVTFLILEIPPRHGKSEMGSIRFPAWFLGRNPEKHIITASYSSDLSTDFGSKTRGFVQSERFQDVFPGFALSEDTKAKSRWLTDKKGSYTSVGVGGALTGRGAHILLIDDPFKSREEADSITIRNKVWSWFRSTAYSRLEPGGVVIVIMQRWHKDDLVGRMLEEYKGREDIEVKEVKYPAVATEKEHIRNYGDALWPERYDAMALESIRKTVGELNWASQYQQNPILQENAEFKPEYFRYFEEEELIGKNLIYTVTVDLATGDKQVKNGDFVAITTVGKEKGSPNWYIVDFKMERISPLETCDYLFYLQQLYRPVRFGIETNSYQKTFKFWLTEEMKKREVYMPIYEIKTTMNKEQKVRGLLPLYQTGVIFHRRHYINLESQLLNFPNDKHDDGPDSLSMQLEVLSNTQQTNTDYNSAANQYLAGSSGLDAIALDFIQKTGQHVIQR